MNIVMISGNLTRDPEIRTTANGNTIANFSMAVNGREKNAQGEWVNRPDYVDCVAFGYQAERVQRLAKGAEVVVSGRLHYSAWETKDGAKRAKLEVTADEVKPCARVEVKKEPEAVTAYYEEEPIPF